MAETRRKTPTEGRTIVGRMLRYHDIAFLQDRGVAAKTIGSRNVDGYKLRDPCRTDRLEDVMERMQDGEKFVLVGIDTVLKVYRSDSVIEEQY